MKKLTILVLSIVVLSVMSLGPIIPVRAADAEAIPKSAASGTMDFVIPSQFAMYISSYGGLLVQANVKSPSGYWPNVIACINGTNYTLAPQVSVGGAKWNISVGVTFKGMICGLANGSYTIKYFAKNETGEVASAANDTENVQYLDFFSAGSFIQDAQIYKNVYKFFITGLIWNCSDPLTIKLNINGSEIVDMIWNNTLQQFEYIKDFGVDTKGTVTYNATIYANTYPYNATLTPWSSITLTAVKKISKIASIGIIKTTLSSDGNKTEDYYIKYQDWNGTAPQKLNISINGVHSALPIQPYTKFYAKESINNGYCANVDYCDGGYLGPYKLVTANATTFNITVFAFNGTEWVNMTMKNNITTFVIKANYNVTIVNQTIFIEAGKRKLNLTINVMYDSGIKINVPTSIDVIYINPAAFATGDSDLYHTWTLNQKDILDGNMTDGKIYSKIIEIGDATDFFFGDIVYKVKIEALLNAFAGTWISVDWISSANFTIDGEDTAAKEYAISGGYWTIYDEITTYDSCMCPTKNTTYRRLSKFSYVGRLFGCDLISVETYTYDYCNKMWINILGSVFTTDDDPFGLGIGTHYCINPKDNASLYESPVYAKDVDMASIVAYLADLVAPLTGIFTLDGKKVTISQKSANQGGYEYTESYEINSKGLKANWVKASKYCCYSMNKQYKFVSEGQGALPDNDGSAGIAGYDVPFVLLGFGLMSFGLVMVSKRRRVV